jgi:hypothetical protein
MLVPVPVDARCPTLMMTKRCRSAGLHVPRALLRGVQSFLDPLGLQQRPARRLRSRQFSVPVPNYMWHMDSFNKLTTFCIRVNGCIDGFSRYITWMHANYTKSKPKVIVSCLICALAEREGCPNMIRSDFGTENVHIKRWQGFLH